MHFGACHKRDLGWLVDGDMATVDLGSLEPGGTLPFLLHPFEVLGDEGVAALRIILPTPIVVTRAIDPPVTISELFVENRRPLGFDSWLEHLESQPRLVYPSIATADGGRVSSVSIAGPQIRGGFYGDGGHCVTTYLLDTHPDSLSYDGEAYTLYDSLDSFLGEGETFHDPLNGFSLTTTALHDDGSVEVELTN